MVFNAAILYAKSQVHIVYRAIGDDGVSRLGYAASSDGYHIDERLANPVFEPTNNQEQYGCEDPRISLLDGRYYMCYTAYGSRTMGIHQVSITSIHPIDFINKRWNWKERWLPFPGIRNKDAALFPQQINGKYAVLHRIHPDICIAYSDNLREWCNFRTIVSPRYQQWDALKVGIAGPPIEVDEGWLVIYHGVNYEKVYALGVLLLHKTNPERVLYRSSRPILQPLEDYERFGAVPNVVFSCGAVRMDRNILIYYGGADRVLCVATSNIDELLPTT